MFRKVHEVLGYPFVDAKVSTPGGPAVDGEGSNPSPSAPPKSEKRVSISDHLPKTATLWFKELMEVYREAEIEFPQLKGITAAQWAWESGWGGSGLAREHNNYAGAKWRAGLEAYGRPVSYGAWDGRDTYFHFNDEAAFIAAYWKRLDLLPSYKGWRDHTATPEAYIAKIGPTWVGMDREHQRLYVTNITRIYNERMKAIFE
jgi:hypothetical protein